MINLPNKIKTNIKSKSFIPESIGKSGADVLCFDDCVLKISTVDDESDREIMMLRYLADKAPVPEIIASEQQNGKNYLLMSRVSGQMACSRELLQNPVCLAETLTEGLHLLWDVDIDESKNLLTLDKKLKLAEMRVAEDLVDTDDCEPETYGENGFENPEQLLMWLEANKPEEELVLSHGDYCLPNIFINDDKISGFIDLGRCGVSDKYQDIALCYRSFKGNLRGDYGGRSISFDCNYIFDCLGIVPDWDKLNYYILLDELF